MPPTVARASRRRRLDLRLQQRAGGRRGRRRRAALRLRRSGHRRLPDPRRHHPQLRGRRTPWGTWLSCEETERGRVYEAFPRGVRDAVRRPAMGRFRHEAAAVDPDAAGRLPDRGREGRLLLPVHPRPLARPRSRPPRRALRRRRTRARSPGGGARPRRAQATRKQVQRAKHFNGGEGCVYGNGGVWFTTKHDGRVWTLDLERQTLASPTTTPPSPAARRSTASTTSPGPPPVTCSSPRTTAGRDVPARPVRRRLGVPAAEGPQEAGDHRTGLLPRRHAAVLLLAAGQENRNSDGITFEVTGPFRDSLLVLPGK